MFLLYNIRMIWAFLSTEATDPKCSCKTCFPKFLHHPFVVFPILDPCNCPHQVVSIDFSLKCQKQISQHFPIVTFHILLFVGDIITMDYNYTGYLAPTEICQSRWLVHARCWTVMGVQKILLIFVSHVSHHFISHVSHHFSEKKLVELHALLISSLCMFWCTDHSGVTLYLNLGFPKVILPNFVNQMIERVAFLAQCTHQQWL